MVRASPRPPCHPCLLGGWSPCCPGAPLPKLSHLGTGRPVHPGLTPPLSLSPQSHGMGPWDQKAVRTGGAHAACSQKALCRGEAAWLSLGPRASPECRASAGLWWQPPPALPEVWPAYPEVGLRAKGTWGSGDASGAGAEGRWTLVTGSVASARAAFILGRSPEATSPFEALPNSATGLAGGKALPCTCSHLPPPSPPSHLGGEGSCLPVVIQHLVTAQAVIVNDVPFDSPEEVRHFVFYQPGLARKRPSSIPYIQGSYLWMLGCK